MAAVCTVTLAQAPQPPAQPPEPGPAGRAAPAPPAQPPQPVPADQAAPAPPAKPVLSYQGKPLPLTAVCADTEIAEFAMDCSHEDPCPIYLELAGYEVAGARIFLAGNFHTNTATLWSLLLSSDDEGKTWQEPFARIRGAALDQVQFVDFQHGWVAGEVIGTLSKDPFLLKSADGGKSWRRIPIYEESAYGSIEQFWFDSPTHGVLLLNRRGSSGGRHQKLESMTGGDSWMMRQSSAAPIPSPKPRSAGAPDWRLRADGPSKSYRFERRQSGKWTAAAAFLFRAGDCRPTPPKPVEPEKPITPEKP